MKKIRLFTLLFCAAMMISICSCSKKQTPADQLVNDLNALTEKLDKTNSMEEAMALTPEMDSVNQIIYNNRDYVLTDKDKEAIIEAMINLTLASSKHSSYTPSEVEIGILKTTLTEMINKANTLGDLIPAGAPAAAEEGVEFVEEVELASPTDSINAEN